MVDIAVIVIERISAGRVSAMQLHIPDHIGLFRVVLQKGRRIHPYPLDQIGIVRDERLERKAPWQILILILRRLGIHHIQTVRLQEIDMPVRLHGIHYRRMVRPVKIRRRRHIQEQERLLAVNKPNLPHRRQIPHLHIRRNLRDLFIHLVADVRCPHVAIFIRDIDHLHHVAP